MSENGAGTAKLGTGTTLGAREHARAQAEAIADAMPVVPASRYRHPPDNVAPDRLTWAETVPAGGYTSKVLARGTTLRLTDRDGDACAHVLLFNADQPWERLNTADTVKVPWQAYLGPAHPLLSDQGRVLATIIASATGSHDALCGCSTRSGNEARYGDGGAHGPTPAGRELLRLAASKHGLEARDLGACVSFFKAVRVGENGALDFRGSLPAAGRVELRAELPLIALIANAPHRLDPRELYTCSPLEVLAWRGNPTSASDPLWTSTPELERAFLNTADYVEAR
jgi:urea carboxylase-associated protein 2